MQIQLRKAGQKEPAVTILDVLYFEQLPGQVQFTIEGDGQTSFIDMSAEGDYFYNGEVYDFCEVYADESEKQPITIQTPQPESLPLLTQNRSKEQILKVVRWAMQEANEMGGPTGSDFSDLMLEIEKEARRQREDNQSAMFALPGEEIRDFSQVIEDYRNCLTWYLEKGKVRPMEIDFLWKHRADVEVLSHEENRRNQ